MEIDEKVKELLNDKKIEEANKKLGYNFYVEGPVMHGLENGRKINFPTLNMEINEKLLPNGVYITRTFIDGKLYKSMTNIGTHPSISELSKPIIETNVINFTDFIYGKIVKVEFLKFIRDQKKFSSLNDLKEQLKKDLILAQNYN